MTFSAKDGVFSPPKLDKPKIKVAVLALGSWGDLFPYLNLYAHLRDVVEPTFFVDQVYVQETKKRAFRVIPFSNLEELLEKDPKIMEKVGVEFIEGWFNYLLNLERVVKMCQTILDENDNTQFDMITSAANADHLVYLLREKIPIPYLRTDVVETSPNYDMHPLIDTKYIPSIFMPMLWSLYAAEVHKIMLGHGLDKCCQFFHRPVETPIEYERRFYCNTPILLGNDQAYLRAKSKYLYPASLTITPRWRPKESAAAAAKADPHEAHLQTLVSNFISANPKKNIGLVAFGSMVVSEKLAQCLKDWILSNLQSNPEFALIVQCGTSCIGTDTLKPLLPSNHPKCLIIQGLMNHDFLFRQVHWLICHGGVGTVHQARRARLPTIVCPFTADQLQTMIALVQEDLSVAVPSSNIITPKDLDQALHQLLQDKVSNWSKLPETTSDGKLLTPDYHLIEKLFYSVLNSSDALAPEEDSPHCCGTVAGFDKIGFCTESTVVGLDDKDETTHHR
mmetsp:Transcript_7476/g.11181  ORF Transcript_7476/g.11181 Transcript_7476/m.11181 type:complete len:506 (+) Transcript_7476:122-1639(+)